MSEEGRRELRPPGGMHPRLGLLFAQLEDVRADFKRKAEGLTPEQLGLSPVDGFLRLGQLLAHCAGAEEWWVRTVLAGETGWDSDPEREEDMGSPGRTLAEILDYMDEVRARTRLVLEGLGEDDLARDFPFTAEDGRRYRFSLEWVLHHLVEHEAHHRGQFALLKRMTA